ncbi:MAG: inositol monophosphatase, partial [Candidatus Hydrogenedentes bacterium]|nr:inositol monophosphatase [Candidatus Hydrogenedentota bacterium]
LAQGQRTVLSDAGRDIKMQADRDAEKAILAQLAPSGFPVLAEESGAHGDVMNSGPVWVVDPLDGTMNFSREIPFYGTSIALLVAGKPVMGVIYDANRSETFSGIVSEGCWLNGIAVTVSNISDPSKAILATGLPTCSNHDSASLVTFVHDMGRFKKVRMLGSAALMLAYVAAGRIDAYSEDDIMRWDVAAGLARVQAAGGFVSDRPSERIEWGRYVRCAGNSKLWES